MLPWAHIYLYITLCNLASGPDYWFGCCFLESPSGIRNTWLCLNVTGMLMSLELGKLSMVWPLYLQSPGHPRVRGGSSAWHGV